MKYRVLSRSGVVLSEHGTAVYHRCDSLARDYASAAVFRAIDIT